MADVATIIIIIILIIIFLACNIYILVYFSHPDDKGSLQGWILKILVILGLTLAWIQIILLPLDVSNNRTFGGDLNIRLFWYILYIFIILYLFLIFPVAFFYYQADEDWPCLTKLKHILCGFVFYFLVFWIIALILYFSIGEAEIPINATVCLYSQISNTSQLPIISNSSISLPSSISEDNLCSSEETTIEVDINFVIYLQGLLTFIAWVIFAIFGGIGLAAVPLDCFYSFQDRPKHMNSIQISKRRSQLIKDIEELKYLGQEIKRLENEGSNKKMICSSERRNYDSKYRLFRAGYAFVDKEYHVVNAENEAREKDSCVIIFYYMLIPIGIFCCFFTILWIVQFICSYFYIKNGRPGYPFLSYLLIYLQDHDVAFIAYIIFGILTLYLLLCIYKGNFKFGVRILCCWTIYNMKKNGTYMDAFIFNVSLILIGSCAVIHFCTDSLWDYVAFTDIDTIINWQIKYLIFFKIFYKYHIFQYLLLAVFIFSTIYLLLRPKENVKNALLKEDIPRPPLANDKNDQNNGNSGNFFNKIKGKFKRNKNENTNINSNTKNKDNEITNKNENEKGNSSGNNIIDSNDDD